MRRRLTSARTAVASAVAFALAAAVPASTVGTTPAAFAGPQAVSMAEMVAATSTGSGPAGLHPADIADAYGLAGGISGGTVGIVIPYHTPTLEADLATYRAQFGLPACTTANGCLRIVGQDSSANLPSTVDNGWSLEASLDVDSVSAACPTCNILFVETDNAGMTSLGTGVDTAVSLGANTVSMSWGMPENIDAFYYQSTYFTHPGVPMIAATGDNAYPQAYMPATMSSVIAVGGTTLSRTNAAAAAQTPNRVIGVSNGAASAAAPVTPAQEHAAALKRAQSDLAKAEAEAASAKRSVASAKKALASQRKQLKKAQAKVRAATKKAKSSKRAAIKRALQSAQKAYSTRQKAYKKASSLVRSRNRTLTAVNRAVTTTAGIVVRAQAVVTADEKAATSPAPVKSVPVPTPVVSPITTVPVQITPVSTSPTPVQTTLPSPVASTLPTTPVQTQSPTQTPTQLPTTPTTPAPVQTLTPEPAPSQSTPNPTPITSAAPQNQAPLPALSYGHSDLTGAFDASRSTDPDGTIVSYVWNFGDGATGTGAVINHTYAAAGTYPVTLTITDDGGATASITFDATVTAPPVVTVSAARGSWMETAWRGAGSGCSTYIDKPAWQTDTACSTRTVADISAVGDYNTGLAVYDTAAIAQGYTSDGWIVVGGTSLATPLIAGMLVRSGHAANYSDASPFYADRSAFWDVTSGSNGSCSGTAVCTAAVGYDGPTGIGTPKSLSSF